MDAFKPLLAKIATGASLRPRRCRARVQSPAWWNGDGGTDRRLSHGPAGARRDGRGDHRRGRSHAGENAARRGTAECGRLSSAPGGDGHGTYNVSTLTALIVAACGVPVAKHGNRAASSKSGSSDVLTALGVKIGLSPDEVAYCLDEAGIGFMTAPVHHVAMRNVGQIRTELGTRTLFNLLGPLANPARGPAAIAGCFRQGMAGALSRGAAQSRLGARLACPWLGRARRGDDHRPTYVTALENGVIRSFVVTPGRGRAPTGEPGRPQGRRCRAQCRGPQCRSARRAQPYRDIAVLNAAATLIVAEKAETLREGVATAARPGCGSGRRSARTADQSVAWQCQRDLISSRLLFCLRSLRGRVIAGLLRVPWAIF